MAHTSTKDGQVRTMLTNNDLDVLSTSVAEADDVLSPSQRCITNWNQNDGFWSTRYPASASSLLYLSASLSAFFTSFLHRTRWRKWWEFESCGQDADKHNSDAAEVGYLVDQNPLFWFQFVIHRSIEERENGHQTATGQPVYCRSLQRSAPLGSSAIASIASHPYVIWLHLLALLRLPQRRHFRVGITPSMVNLVLLAIQLYCKEQKARIYDRCFRQRMRLVWVLLAWLDLVLSNNSVFLTTCFEQGH